MVCQGKIDSSYQEIGLRDRNNEVFFANVHWAKPCNDIELILARMKGFSFSGHIVDVFKTKSDEIKSNIKSLKISV